jgi:hypothetical protein
MIFLRFINIENIYLKNQKVAIKLEIFDYIGKYQI